MRNWRVLTAVVAAVLALLAAVLAYSYLTEADERAQDDVAGVDVLRAAGDIPKGTTGAVAAAEGLVEVFEVPRNAVPDSAFTDESQITDLVAASAVSARQFLTPDNFVDAARLEGFSATLGEGMQAISVIVDPARGVAGFIAPNDSVNVMVTYQPSAAGQLLPPDQPAPGGGAGADNTRGIDVSAFLVPGAKVLGVGQTTATTATSDGEGEGETATTVESGLITLEVTPRQALQISHAIDGGGLVYLSLNTPGFDAEELSIPAEIVEDLNWFDQELSVLNSVRGQLGQG